MIIISACLAGIECRYDGKLCINKEIKRLYEDGKALPLCPEMLGGLPTPRKPAEIVNNKVLTEDGKDITDKIKEGVKDGSSIAYMLGVKEAILKSNSPSCGYKKVYDGTFTHTLTNGNGLFAQELERIGVKITTVD